MNRFQNWGPLHKQTSANEKIDKNEKYDDSSDDDVGGGKHFSSTGFTDIASGVGNNEENSTGLWSVDLEGEKRRSTTRK